jgi:hypothetical protein
MTPAGLITLSGERDLALRLRLAAWRDGYAAAAGEFAAHEAAGYARAIADVKAAQHGAVRDLRQHLVTWDGLRTRFGDPRPGDYRPRTQVAR